MEIWIQQFNFGRNQKHLWKCFYTVKKSLKYRAIIGIRKENTYEGAQIGMKILGGFSVQIRSTM